MRKCQCLFFVLQRSYICYYIICMTVPLNFNWLRKHVKDFILTNSCNKFFPVSIVKLWLSKCLRVPAKTHSSKDVRELRSLIFCHLRVEISEIFFSEKLSCSKKYFPKKSRHYKYENRTTQGQLSWYYSKKSEKIQLSKNHIFH